LWSWPLLGRSLRWRRLDQTGTKVSCSGLMTGSWAVATEQRRWSARHRGRKGEFALAPTRLNRGWRRWPSVKLQWCHSMDASARSKRHRSDREADSRAPRGLIFFVGIPKPVQFVKSKRVPYVAPKIPKFRMRLD
jgi:hypothetical protein